MARKPGKPFRKVRAKAGSTPAQVRVIDSFDEVRSKSVTPECGSIGPRKENEDGILDKEGRSDAKRTRGHFIDYVTRLRTQFVPLLAMLLIDTFGHDNEAPSTR